MNPQILKTVGKVLTYVGTGIVSAIIAGILVSKYKDRANKEFNRKHDQETAERLSKEFDQKLDSLKKEYNDKIIETKEELNLKVSNLCKRYGIDPEMVVR